MARIRRLSADLANQIAAGEVVERPASVVKELVENALDAGATRITVALEDGGLALLRVSDDGVGMDQEDALLALERHATSKIERFEDLQAIGTFGFRGEALPSIGSVAKLTLTTRTREADEAVQVIVEGGGTPRVVPAGAAPGTTVEVRDLFFNVPARRKFLKKPGTESAHVSEVVLMAALARPEVTFVLERDGKKARELLRVGTRGERARQAFSDERLEACVGERGRLRVEAFLGAPERARSGAVALHCFVNGRPVRDRLLARSVAQAYGSVLEPGRYPVGIVYIELPPELVDVNVHPQKAEVRFADARGVLEAVTRELHAELARAFALPAGPLFRRPGYVAPPAARALGQESQEPWRYVPAAPGAAPAAFGAGSVASAPGPSTSAAPGGELLPWEMLADKPAEADPWGLAPSAVPLPLAEPPAPAAAPGVSGALFAQGGFYGRLTFLAQLRATFLLCEGADGLYVLDQHAAAERVTFHKLRTAYAKADVASQRLLLPEVVELAPAEVSVLEEHADDVARFGVELRAVGTSAVAVHAVPKVLVRQRPERIVRDLVAELGRLAKRPFSDAADLVLATMACHGSVRAGDVMSAEEARALLRALDEVDFAGHCPHGRPVVMRLSYGELEERVGRT